MRCLNTLLILALSTLLTGCEKYALDRQMEELCAKDGGIKVYEKVVLPKEMFDEYGNPFPPRMRSTNKPLLEKNRYFRVELLGTQYRFESETLYIKSGDPVKGEGVLRRFSEKIFRLSDQKLLGEAISFGRTGGDFVAFAHPSSKHCPSAQGSNAVTRAVFKQSNGGN